MRKLIITLTILGLVSAAVLAFVYQWTKPMIEKHQEDARAEALKAVLPESDSFKEVVKNGITFYEGNEPDEVAMITSGGGFQGEIELMIGFNPDKQKIYAIRILNHSETPGLGAFITGDKYLSNWEDKPFGDYNVVKHPRENDMQIEAISGATISSTKVTNIVEDALGKIKSAYGGGA